MGIARTFRAALVALLLPLAACTGMRATSDRFPGADLSGYRTFAWIAEDPQILARGAESPISSLTARRIRVAVEAAMLAKGYRMEAAADADIVLAFIVGTRDRIEAQSYPFDYRGPWLWHGHGEGRDLRVYREGTLTIEVFDRTSRQPVWRGTTTKEVTSADAANPGPAIQEAVAAILAKFPSR